MSQGKGKIPSHIQPKKFNHPSTSRIVLIISEIEDPRKPSCNFRHSLVTILFISLIGVLCGAKDWEEIVQATDALNTQKKAAKAIIDQQADYVLPLKENHKDFYEDVKLLFEESRQKRV